MSRQTRKKNVHADRKNINSYFLTDLVEQAFILTDFFDNLKPAKQTRSAQQLFVTKAEMAGNREVAWDIPIIQRASKVCGVGVDFCIVDQRITKMCLAFY